MLETHHLENAGTLDDRPELYADEVIAICERILRDCTDNSPRNSAIQTLVCLYGNPHSGKFDEAKAAQIPSIVAGKRCFLTPI